MSKIQSHSHLVQCCENVSVVMIVQPTIAFKLCYDHLRLCQAAFAPCLLVLTLPAFEIEAIKEIFKDSNFDIDTRYWIKLEAFEKAANVLALTKQIELEAVVYVPYKLYEKDQGDVFIPGVFTDISTAIAWSSQAPDPGEYYSFHTFDLNEVRYESEKDARGE